MANQEALIIRDSGGTEADVTASNALKVDGSAVIQPISASSLPLPAGAATAANQQTDALTDAELRATPVPVSGTITITPSGTQNVDVTGNSVGLATQATLATIDADTSILAGAVSGTEMQVDVVAPLPAGTNNIGDVDVLSMPAITGTVTANAGTNLNTSALALESGGNLASINTKIPALGQATMANSTPVVIASNQSTIPVSFAAASVLFRGLSGTFRTLGRAGTAGQKIMAIHNATGSPVTVTVTKIIVDMWCTVVKAVTVAPPIVRIWKFTAVPTNGNTITKNKIGGTTTSNAAVTVWNDSSADGTGSATTLTVTLPSGTILDQLVCPRVITAVGEVDTNPMKFEYNPGITLSALEGVCVFLDYTAAGSNPITDMWVASMEWTET